MWVVRFCPKEGATDAWVCSGDEAAGSDCRNEMCNLEGDLWKAQAVEIIREGALAVRQGGRTCDSLALMREKTQGHFSEVDKRYHSDEALLRRGLNLLPQQKDSKFHGILSRW